MDNTNQKSLMFFPSSGYSSSTEDDTGNKIYYGIYKVHPKEIAKRIPRPISPIVPLDIVFSLHDQETEQLAIHPITKPTSFDNGYNSILFNNNPTMRSLTPPPRKLVNLCQ